MSKWKIPFNKPGLRGRELDYVGEAVAYGHTSMSGPFSKKVSDLLTDELDAAGALLTTSCTDALEMTAMLLDLKEGDTVIVPSFTFVSTALAFTRQGAKVRFCDIDPATLGADAASVAELMDDSVRAIVPVHYAGVPCAIEDILTIANEYENCSVIEDNAHGLFSSQRGRPLGSFGRFSTLSFHETKNFTCGEGGALIVNEEADMARSFVLRDKGTDRTAFQMGLVDKYSWKDTGSSFGLSDLLAAYLLAQLEDRNEVLAERSRVTETYREMLEPLQEELGFTVPAVPEDCVPGHHMFHVLVDTPERRKATLQRMHEDGVQATFHYVPLHSADAGRKFSDGQQDCPVTDDVSARLIRLPYFNALTFDECALVVDAFTTALRSCSDTAQ